MVLSIGMQLLPVSYDFTPLLHIQFQWGKRVAEGGNEKGKILEVCFVGNHFGKAVRYLTKLSDL